MAGISGKVGIRPKLVAGNSWWRSSTGTDGTTVPVMVPVEGFHVNIRMRDGASLPAALLPFLVTPLPATPAEIFA